jgi:hypothetical protein
MIRYLIAAAFATASTLSAGADAPSPYAPLAFLAGHCWRGELPGGKKDMDTHCFSWIYGDKFIRDVHTVHGEGHKDYLGESVYFWDGAAKKLQYLYVENAGGSSMGAVEAVGNALVFPPTDYQEDGKTQTYRSRWTHSAADAYDVVTEFKKGDAWITAWTVHMVAAPDSSAAAASK